MKSFSLLSVGIDANHNDVERKLGHVQVGALVTVNDSPNTPPVPAGFGQQLPNINVAPVQTPDNPPASIPREEASYKKANEVVIGLSFAIQLPSRKDDTVVGLVFNNYPSCPSQENEFIGCMRTGNPTVGQHRRYSVITKN